MPRLSTKIAYAMRSAAAIDIVPQKLMRLLVHGEKRMNQNPVARMTAGTAGSIFFPFRLASNLVNEPAYDKCDGEKRAECRVKLRGRDIHSRDLLRMLAVALRNRLEVL